MTKTTQDRICWIDNIKGLCILLVLYNHHPDYVFPYSWLFTTAELVPFFVLSGFLHIKPLTGNFAKKILIPYFVYGTIACVADVLYVYPWRNMIVPDFFCAGLLYGRNFIDKDNTEPILTANAGPLWFLLCFFVTKVFFDNIWKYLHKNKYEDLNFMLVLIFAFTISALLHSCPYHLPWSFDIAPLSLSFMVTGYLLRKYYSCIPLKMIAAVSLLACFFFFAIINGNTDISSSMYGSHGRMSILLFYIEGMCFTLFLMIVFAKLSEKNIISFLLSYIGKNSMRLLCIHGLLMNNLFMYFFDLMGAHRYGKLVILVPMLLLFSHLLGLLYNKLSERFPWVSYL